MLYFSKHERFEVAEADDVFRTSTVRPQLKEEMPKHLFFICKQGFYLFRQSYYLNAFLVPGKHKRVFVICSLSRQLKWMGGK